jgi:hypothetical protein
MEAESGQQLQQEQNDLHLLLETRSQTGGFQEEDQCQPALFGLEQ